MSYRSLRDILGETSLEEVMRITSDDAVGIMEDAQIA